jgi:hypothetical protein
MIDWAYSSGWGLIKMMRLQQFARPRIKYDWYRRAPWPESVM